jgi:hypothetical protein
MSRRLTQIIADRSRTEPAMGFLSAFICVICGQGVGVRFFFFLRALCVLCGEKLESI